MIPSSSGTSTTVIDRRVTTFAASDPPMHTATFKSSNGPYIMSMFTHSNINYKSNCFCYNNINNNNNYYYYYFYYMDDCEVTFAACEPPSRASMSTAITQTSSAVTSHRRAHSAMFLPTTKLYTFYIRNRRRRP